VSGQGLASRAAAAMTRPYGRDLNGATWLVARVTAILSIGAGMIHLSAAADHTNLPVMMAGFLVVASLQVALGGLLLWRRPGWALIAAAVGLMLSSVGLWMLSRTAGLPFLPGGHMEPIGFKDGVTVLFEICAVPGLLLLGSRDLGRVSLPSPRLGTQALAVAGAGSFLLLVPALVLGGGEHHSHDEAVALGIHEHDGGHASKRGARADAGHGDASAGGGHDHGSSQAGGGAHAHGTGEAGGAAAGSGHGAHGDDAPAAGGGRFAFAPAGGHSHGDSGAAPSPRSTAPASGHAHSRSDSSPATGGHEHSAAQPKRPAAPRRPQGGGHEHPAGGGRSGQGQSGAAAGDGHGDHGSPGGQGGGGQGHGDHGQPGGHGGDPDEDAGKNIGVTWEPGDSGQDGRPSRGSALVFRSPNGPYEKGAHGGETHHGRGDCNPTPEQQAVADKLYADTKAALARYENNPAAALEDGFYQVVGPADRFVHMISPERVFDDETLDPARIESFMYAMTDRGLVPLGGMYIMPSELEDGKVVPKEPKQGPEVAGCLTKWHKHEGWVAGFSTGGTNWEETPEMLHVWTYPGLDPWGHYAGRELSQLWAPWRGVPSVCRISYPEGTNVCFP
jgi:hypothetical protein